MAPTRKFESGSSKCKRKQKEAQFIDSQRGSMDSFSIKKVSEYHLNEESVGEEHKEKEEAELHVPENMDELHETVEEPREELHNVVEEPREEEVELQVP
ncbi:unnamed protein product [Lactuca virosa]|uniref:Uncharacterized protein n=1 Tax=Lactuca virosa TaxID=75947 RepID=A0AAU9MEU0_9ASTR|nr:unnamed protein product [Lactuca virosa]